MEDGADYLQRLFLSEHVLEDAACDFSIGLALELLALEQVQEDRHWYSILDVYEGGLHLESHEVALEEDGEDIVAVDLELFGNVGLVERMREVFRQFASYL